MKELYWKYMVQVKDGSRRVSGVSLYFPKQQNRRYGEKRSNYVNLPVMDGLPVMKSEVQYPNRKEMEERQ